MHCKGIWLQNLLLFLTLIASSEAASRIRAGNNTYFVDDGGRIVLLRGLNVVGRAKVPDFAPFYNLGVLDSLATYGTNVARLPFIWEAYEPVRKQFNTTYLNYYRSVVEYLYTLGILSIVDVHQDGFSRYLGGGCGDGFPRWAIPSRYNPQTTAPNNGLSCENWKYAVIFDTAIQGSWKAFYANENGVRDSFLSLWNTLSSTFAGNPAVLGYDIINEPTGSERREVQPLWEDAAKVIRNNDPDGILFLTPIFILGLGGQSGIQKPNFTNYAIGVHWYPQDSLTGISTETALGMWFDLVYPWGAPIFIGEFGAQPTCPDSGINGTTVPKLVNGLYNFWDANYLSFAQWFWTNTWRLYDFDGWNNENYSILNEFLLIRENYMIRPYPRAVAGIPVSFKVLQRNKAFQLVWNVTAANLPPLGNPRTVVFAPAMQFFNVASNLQLNITYGGPDPAQENMCSYINPDRGTLITCTSVATGIHYLRVERLPGVPAHLTSEFDL